MKKVLLFSVMAALAFNADAAKPKVGEVLPDWKEGYLDIHAINTGKGDCTFFIMPDGTTMLVDAGESNGRTPNLVDQKPDTLTAPYVTYTRYIDHFLPKNNKQLDYILLSHFHMDHMGDVYAGNPAAKEGRPYVLTGLAGIGDEIPFKKVIDRGWPDYKTPIEPISAAFPNYLSFIKWHKENKGVEIEQFRPGKTDQIVLTQSPDKYPKFQVRNIAANGIVWTGVEDVTRNHFIPSDQIKNKADLPDENQCSIAFRVSYGPFDYFTGGDLPAVTNQDWQCLEVPVGTATGPVEAMKSNHHMNYDAMGVPLLRALRPKVVVLHNAKAQQPDIEVLRRILSKTRAYPGKKAVFSTNEHPATKFVAYPNTQQMPARQGHIVIRVMPGGEKFYVYCLEDSDFSYKIKSIHGPYKCD